MESCLVADMAPRRIYVYRISCLRLSPVFPSCFHRIAACGGRVGQTCISCAPVFHYYRRQGRGFHLVCRQPPPPALQMESPGNPLVPVDEDRSDQSTGILCRQWNRCNHSIASYSERLLNVPIEKDLPTTQTVLLIYTTGGEPDDRISHRLQTPR